MGKSEVNPFVAGESSGTSDEDFEVLGETTQTCDGQATCANGEDEPKTEENKDKKKKRSQERRDRKWEEGHMMMHPMMYMMGMHGRDPKFGYGPPGAMGPPGSVGPWGPPPYPMGPKDPRGPPEDPRGPPPPPDAMGPDHPWGPPPPPMGSDDSRGPPHFRGRGDPRGPPPFMAWGFHTPMGRGGCDDPRGPPEFPMGYHPPHHPHHGGRRHGWGARRCHSAPGDRNERSDGGSPRACGGRRRRCGSPGPRMRRRFLRRALMSDPEFWERVRQRYENDEETQKEDPEKNLAEEFSKMDVEEGKDGKKMKKCGGMKKCHGRKKWRRFMKHFREEMRATMEAAANQTTSEESEEVEAGMEVSEEEKGKEGRKQEGSTGAEAADKARKVHFEEGTKDEDAMLSGMSGWMFPAGVGGPWGRGGMFGPGAWGKPGMFGGPWRRHGRWGIPGPSRGFGRRGCPRMFPGFRRRWMFRHMMRMQNPTGSSEEASTSEGEGQGQSAGRRDVTREQRKEWRKMAREMGWFPRRWRSMSQSDESEAEKSQSEPEMEKMQQQPIGEKDQDQEARIKMREDMRKGMHEKRLRLRELIRELEGVQPWMFRLLAHQIYGPKPEEAEGTGNEKKEKMGPKKQKFVATLQEIGAHPWMFRVLANQSGRRQEKDGKKKSAEDVQEPEGATAAAEVQTGSDPMAEDVPAGSEEMAGNWRGFDDVMRSRRRMWRQMAEQMGWISASSDSEATTTTSASDEEGPVSDEEETKKERKKEEKREERERKREEREKYREERQRMREMMREHHHHHHHPRGGAHGHHDHPRGGAHGHHVTRRHHHHGHHDDE